MAPMTAAPARTARSVANVRAEVAPVAERSPSSRSLIPHAPKVRNERLTPNGTSHAAGRQSTNTIAIVRPPNTSSTRRPSDAPRARAASSSRRLTSARGAALSVMKGTPGRSDDERPRVHQILTRGSCARHGAICGGVISGAYVARCHPREVRHVVVDGQGFDRSRSAAAARAQCDADARCPPRAARDLHGGGGGDAPYDGRAASRAVSGALQWARRSAGARSPARLTLSAQQVRGARERALVVSARCVRPAPGED